MFGLPLPVDSPAIVAGLPPAGPRPHEPDFDATPLPPGHPWMVQRNIPLVVARVPLHFQGRPQGVVVLARRLAWTEAERDFIRDAARPFAIALANDRAYAASVALARALEDRNDVLAQQRDQLAVVDRLRTQFVANMSHELRTPLNAIIGYSELLADDCFGEVTEQQRTQLEHVLDASNHLLGLVNQVLDLSRAEAGAIDLDAESCDVLELARDVTQLAEGLCRDRPYTPTVAGPSVVIHTDRARVQQILTNLVGNAIKFTPAGSVTVHVVRTMDGGAQLVVEDTGCGIDPAHAEVIFEEFRQADGSSTRAHDGVGLGLAISRRLAQALGGRLEVQSKPDVGSRFTLSLPAAAPSQAALSASAQPQAV